MGRDTEREMASGKKITIFFVLKNYQSPDVTRIIRIRLLQKNTKGLSNTIGISKCKVAKERGTISTEHAVLLLFVAMQASNLNEYGVLLLGVSILYLSISLCAAVRYMRAFVWIALWVSFLVVLAPTSKCNNLSLEQSIDK